LLVAGNEKVEPDTDEDLIMYSTQKRREESYSDRRRSGTSR
jgi:hypothetical protein